MLAGIVLTAILAPVGMGYAEAAGLPAVCGLYATIIPLLVYALTGPSAILVLGPDSALIPLVAATILPLAGSDPLHAVTLASFLSILTGLVIMLAGAARLGFITDLLSKPIRCGYMNGVAITLLIGQLPKAAGFNVDSGSFISGISGLARGVAEGKVNWKSSALAIFSLVVIFFFRYFFPRISGIFVAVALSTIIVILLPCQAREGIQLIGELPRGLPDFAVPLIKAEEFLPLLAGSVAIALVSITDMSILSRVYALRGGYYSNQNQELVALGLANTAAGFFHGFPVSSSASRTPVAEAAGAKSQMTCLVGALSLAVLLIFAPGILRNTPTAALASVVIAAGITILDISQLARLFTLRRGEFFISAICTLTVLFMGVIQGIFIAVGIALLIFIWRAWRPYHAVLGRIDGVKGYHDISRHPEARLVPGLVLFRWDAPLFFANAEMFREKALRAISDAPTATRRIVIVAEPVTDIDITAADMLAELADELEISGIELCFAVMKGRVKDHLKRYGLYSRFGDDSFSPTVGHAVESYIARYKVNWVDWEELSGLQKGDAASDKH